MSESFYYINIFKELACPCHVSMETSHEGKLCCIMGVFFSLTSELWEFVQNMR